MNQTANATQQLIDLLFTNYTPETPTEELKPSQTAVSLLPEAYKKTEEYGVAMAFQLLSNVKLDSQFVMRHTDALDLDLIVATTLLEVDSESKEKFKFALSAHARTKIVKRVIKKDFHGILHHGDKTFSSVANIITSLIAQYGTQSYVYEIGDTYESDKDFSVAQFIEMMLNTIAAHVTINVEERLTEEEASHLQDAAFSTINRFVDFLSAESINNLITKGLVYPPQAILKNKFYTTEQFIEHAYDYLELAELTSFASDLALNADKGTPEQLKVLDLTLDIIAGMHNEKRFSAPTEEAERFETVDEETFDDLNK